MTCAYAALSGHLRMLQWAREHHCPWAASAGSLAAVNGQLEVLQWMRENDATGEVWREDCVRACAAVSRKQEVLTWLDQLIAP